MCLLLQLTLFLTLMSFRCRFNMLHQSGFCDLDVRHLLDACSVACSFWQLYIYVLNKEFCKFIFQVASVLPIRGGLPPKHAQRIQLITDTYEVV